MRSNSAIMRLDLRDLAPLLVDLEFLQADERLARLHRLVLPRSPEYAPSRPTAGPAPDGPVRSMARTVAATTLVFGFCGREDLLKPLISLRHDR